MNAFSGSLPEEGVLALSSMTGLHLFINRFRGSLPEKGLHALSLLEEINVAHNDLEGTLPARGIRSMSAMILFWIARNAFAGTLPDHGFNGLGFTGMCVESTQLEGQLPGAAVSASSMEFVLAGNTRIEGSKMSHCPTRIEQPPRPKTRGLQRNLSNTVIQL
eukprot:2855161-Amphidinium_carterae.1